MNEEPYFKKVQSQLNEKSPSMCLAKWLQVTIHLQNGLTHSCHHPPTHKIPMDEVSSNPSALHNTNHKKAQRKKMIEGKRPLECDYCWRIEDAHVNNLSDRTYKSADHWAYPHFNDVTSQPWDKDIEPTYVEVSFGNECQFKCSYCSPTISSAILAEVQKFGAYKTQPYNSIEELKNNNQYPYSKDEVNPYVEAFWEWWPKLSKKLEVFRITGGEPLLNPNTFRFLEKIIESPMPNLDLAINSNLSVPDIQLNRFIALAKNIVGHHLVKKFEIYTSIDTYGAQSEYIRFGLNYEKFISNMRFVLESLPDVNIVIMCTFNIFSVPQFEKFLRKLKELKVQYRKNDCTSRIQLSISYLRHPEYMAANILPSRFHLYIEKSLDYMLRNTFLEEEYFQIFSEFEISQLRRILEWLKHDEMNAEKIKELRKSFYIYFAEYDERKGTSMSQTFPEFDDFLREIELTFT